MSRLLNPAPRPRRARTRTVQANIERARIDTKLTQMGSTAGRTIAARRAKREMEERLAALNKRTSKIRMDLRHLVD